MTDEERKKYDEDVLFRNAICEHGSQRRKCNICELFCEQYDNAALRARVAVLEKVAEAASTMRRKMIVYHTRPDTCDCFVCVYDRAALDALKEG
jgi:hypothetical protein